MGTTFFCRQLKLRTKEVLWEKKPRKFSFDRHLRRLAHTQPQRSLKVSSHTRVKKRLRGEEREFAREEIKERAERKRERERERLIRN